ncbi:uncharacterized protein LOC129222130 [Uloborus diversus]|uniref:uncharacterized protein LOC129222130 n=1 Tax=Uloborus diversus TaxID=327109 RepID=UPI0024093F32|nr:uncharacterized protein LOC129222130 [Uloborus diversus]XP_054712556.1 uncharacterized protein LOC129222130 [Uloborus diversus]
MSDGEVDIRLLALRRQQKRHQSKSSTIEHQVLEPANNTYSRVRSGHSAYETTPIKAYTITDSSRNSTPRRNSFLSNIAVPLFDEDVRIARMHVPPVVRCECNGIEAYALISTSETVSTISIDFVRKLKLLDQVIPEPSNVFNPLALHNPELKGKVKYIDLAIGIWQQVAQFNIVENYVSDVTLGIDFLRRTQSMVNFEGLCFDYRW